MKKFMAGVGLALLSVCNVSFAVPEIDYWSLWDKSIESNTQRIDHSALDEILRTYVVSRHKSGINRFRYSDVSAPHRKQIDAYVKKITAVDPRDYSRAEQKAYWLNLYNALTLQLILANYPVDSIENIPGPGAGPWDKKIAKVAGEDISLNDIENRILRPIWQDHKVIFGLACAGLGCPNVQPLAFTADNCQDLLKESGREFVNNSRGVDLKNGELHASKLFDWYKVDFAKNDKDLLKVFARYMEDNKALYLLGFTGTIQYAHDWRLNAP